MIDAMHANDIVDNVEAETQVSPVASPDGAPSAFIPSKIRSI
ncbi:MAG TPA: hypothetical protein VFK04_12375 [Gemmatimonadaceae bacterium]|nr:hypothetical protein [Gemmatimonadaceae bacterium]